MKKKAAKPRAPKAKPKLGLSVAARSLRDQFAQQLGSRLRPEDIPALEFLCRSILLLERAYSEAEGGDIVVTQSTKVTSMNQAIRAVCELERVVAKGYARFGLTPLDRAVGEEAGFDPAIAARKPSEPPPHDADSDLEGLLNEEPSSLPFKRDAV